MYQARLWACKWILLAYLLSTSAIAQSFFTSGTGTNFSSSANTAKNQPSPVLTPDEYKNQVNTLHQQTINNTQAKYQQQYSSKSSTQSISSYNPPAISNPVTPPIPNPAATSVMPQPAAPSAASAAPPINNQPGSPIAPTAPVPQGGRQDSNTYTGFGSTGDSDTKAPASGSGGWNIKY